MSEEWERKGECEHCGYCCEFLGPTGFMVKPVEGMELELRFHELRRPVHLTKDQALFLVHLYAPCSAYNFQAQRCSIYETRPVVCQIFPTKPSQIEGTPCTYWFERTDADGKVERRGGKGSKYPTLPIEALRLAKKKDT